jgi:hypothetical protein
MRVRHWLIGCAICFAGIGGAAATSVDSRELDGSQHASGDVSSARDLGNSGEPGVSEIGPTHDSTRHSGNDLRKGASGNGASDRSGIDVTPPAHVPPTHLGWQSLLPGSIQ